MLQGWLGRAAKAVLHSGCVWGVGRGGWRLHLVRVARGPMDWAGWEGSQGGGLQLRFGPTHLLRHTSSTASIKSSQCHTDTPAHSLPGSLPSGCASLLCADRPGRPTACRRWHWSWRIGAQLAADVSACCHSAISCSAGSSALFRQKQTHPPPAMYRPGSVEAPLEAEAHYPADFWASSGILTKGCRHLGGSLMGGCGQPARP